MKIHWQPQPKQETALLSEADETLFGGSRGGGKTDAGMIWMIEPDYIRHPRYRGLVIRKNADDLRDWIDRAEYLYRPTRAVFAGNPVEITFPSGSKIRTGHLKDEKAYGKYQGHEYQKMLIEELTQIPLERNYEKLIGSCRSTISELKPRIFATTNPDGDGYDWVKQRFNIPDWPDKPVEFIKKIIDTKTGNISSRTFTFIPSWVEDNIYLLKSESYLNYLNSIQDETLKKQWRLGSWEEPKIEGAYYAKQFEKARVDNRIITLPIELSMPVDTVWDLGIGDSMAIWFFQCIGREVHLINYFEGEGEGINFYVKEVKNWANENGVVLGEHYMPHDAEVREQSDGITRREKAENYGLLPLYIIPRDERIEDGIDEARMFFERCWFEKDKCKEGLRALKNYRKIFDEKRNCYKNTPDHNWASHGSDAFRGLAKAYRLFKVGQSSFSGLGQKKRNEWI